MSLPKEPRQKMVNLMYLVLTALLALNVSAEILNAFKTISASIEKSNASIESKNAIIYKQMDKKLQDKPAVKPIVDASVRLRQLSQEAFDYLNGLKLELLKRAKYDPATETYEESNIDIPSLYFLTQKKGIEMHDKLEKYIEDTKALIDVKDTSYVFNNCYALSLAFKKSKSEVNPAKEVWEYKYFNMTPVVAALAILNKFQNDLRNTEAAILEHFFKKIGEDVIIYDKLEPFVSATSDYILLGGTYEAAVGVGALSSTVKPIIKVNGVNIPVSGGIGRYKETPTTVGDRKLNIEVTLKKADGSFETTRKLVSYSVGASAGVTVSADGMNLFYIGIDNPVTVIGSVGDEKLNVSISQGSITRQKPGKYTVRVVEAGDCFVSVAEKGKSAVKFPFRVKPIPDPIIKVGGLKPGNVTASEFNSQTGILAVLENFEFDAYFSINSYKLLLSGAGFPDIFQGDMNGPSFTPAVEKALNKIRKGTIITLIDIYVTGPDKKARRLSSVSYMIK